MLFKLSTTFIYIMSTGRRSTLRRQRRANYRQFFTSRRLPADQLYCGNNHNFSGLQDGTHYIGTRHSCLKKGRRVGYAMPIDPEYSAPYAPIVVQNLFCLDHNQVPPNAVIGTLHQCLSKGIGEGKAAKAHAGQQQGGHKRSRHHNRRTRRRR